MASLDGVLNPTSWRRLGLVRHIRQARKKKRSAPEYLRSHLRGLAKPALRVLTGAGFVADRCQGLLDLLHGHLGRVVLDGQLSGGEVAAHFGGF